MLKVKNGHRKKKVNGISKKSQHVLSYQSLCYSPVKFYGHRCKIARVGTFYVAVIRGESCFEKNAFEDTENPHRTRPLKLDFRLKNISGNIRDIEKNFVLF